MVRCVHGRITLIHSITFIMEVGNSRIPYTILSSLEEGILITLLPLSRSPVHEDIDRDVTNGGVVAHYVSLCR